VLDYEVILLFVRINGAR